MCTPTTASGNGVEPQFLIARVAEDCIPGDELSDSDSGRNDAVEFESEHVKKNGLSCTATHARSEDKSYHQANAEQCAMTLGACTSEADCGEPQQSSFGETISRSGHELDHESSTDGANARGYKTAVAARFFPSASQNLAPTSGDS